MKRADKIGVVNYVPLIPMSIARAGLSELKAFWRLLFVLCGLSFSPGWISAAGVSSGSASSLPVLTNAAQLRALLPAEVKRGYPVRFRGVVVYCSHKTPGNFILQDETADVFIEQTPGKFTPVERGQIVEVEGIGNFVTVSFGVKLSRLRVLGQGKIPEPRPVAYEQLIKGNEDSQWVEVRGVIRSVPNIKPKPSELLPIELMMDGGRLIVRLEKYDLQKMQSMVDAEVKVRGLCFNYFNDRRQIFNVRVSVQEMEDIQVTRPAPANPFEAPLFTSNQLLTFNGVGRPDHRIRIEGIVIGQPAEGTLFIRSQQQGIQIYTDQTSPTVNLGDRVDVLGFVEMGEYSPVLRHSIYRQLKPGPPVIPISVSAQQALLHDADLVRIQARLLEQIPQPSETILVLQTSNAVFNAHLHTAGAEELLTELRPGSEVDVTGISQVSVGDLSEYLKIVPIRTPRAFRLLLRSPNDIIVLRSASWWTRTRALWVLAGVSVACLGVLIWIAALKYRVQVQTEIIRHKIERETVMEERARIARDMHDDLGARLTQIRLFSELSKHQSGQLHQTPVSMQQISDTARDAVRAMDEIVWALNPRNDSLASLLEFLSQYANEYLRIAGILCRQDFPEDAPDRQVSSGMRHHLLLAVKEALQNIVKHSQATEVWLRVTLEDEVLRFSIEDNGCGFVPGQGGVGHDGVENIQTRIREIGGECQLTSAPGAGVSLLFKIPLGPAKTTGGPVPFLGDRHAVDKAV